MKLLCAWCEKEGKPAFLADVEPLEDPSKTHGICPAHRRQVEDEVTRLREDAGRQRRAAEQQHAAAEKLRQNVDP